MATVTKPLALNESLNSTENTPRNIADVLADELDGIKQAINSQSGSGNGHIIQNSSGANMPSENTMQFVDAHLSDDSVGGKTKVETFKAVTEAEYSSETEDGAYIITDGDGATIEPASKDYVEVTADGDKTYATLLNELWALIDMSKISHETSLMFYDYQRNANDYYTITRKRNNNNYLYFICDTEWGSTTTAYIGALKISPSDSKFIAWEIQSTASSTDVSSSVPVSGTKFILYYGNKKAIVDLQTTANRCWMSNGESVESAFTWKYLTNITDHNAHAINVNFRELFIIGLFGAISATLIPLVASTRSGYYSSSSDYGDMFATYANGGLTIVNYKINGTDQIARGVNVYYR